MKVIYSRYTRYTNVLYTFEASEGKVPLFDPNSATIRPELWHYSPRIRQLSFFSRIKTVFHPYGQLLRQEPLHQQEWACLAGRRQPEDERMKLFIAFTRRQGVQGVLGSSRRMSVNTESSRTLNSQSTKSKRACESWIFYLFLDKISAHYSHFIIKNNSPLLKIDFFPCKTRQKQTVPSADVVSLHRDSEITERCAKLKAYV